VYSTSANPAVLPVVDNLGTATSFDGRTVTGSLAAGASERHAFSVRASEVTGTTAGDEVLVRVSVRTTGGSLRPLVPQIPGLAPRSSFSETGNSDALFAVPREGLYHVVVAAAAGTSGTYEMQLSIAGDLNADGLVDGLDSALLAAAQGGHDFTADLDGNGVVN